METSRQPRRKVAPRRPRSAALAAIALLAPFYVPINAIAAEATASARPTLHYRPTDCLLGDVHPYFEAGKCHLFYLRSGGFHSALAQSTDLRHWKEIAVRHDGAGRDEWFAPYYVLNVFRDAKAGVYRSFYGVGGRMAGSVSPDLRAWQSAKRECSVPCDPTLYSSQRDPYVFWNATAKQYWCLMTSRVKGGPRGREGAIAYATSPDLVHWKSAGHLFYPGDMGEPECPQMFQVGKQWYLLASIFYGSVGKPSYWVADAPTGPWRTVGAGCLDGKDLCAAQVASDGARLLLFGWIPIQPSGPGNRRWGGHLALPREVYPLADGVLATRLPDALARSIRGKAVADIAATLDLAASPDHGRFLPGRHDRGDLEVELSWPADARRAGIRLEDLAAGGEVEISVERHPARLTIGEKGGAIYSEMAIAAPAGGPVRLHVIFEEDMVEAFLDGRYSLAARTARKLSAARVGFFAEGCAVQLRNVRLCQLN